MTLTVLLDLDDTLLINDLAAFLPAYLQALGGYLDEFPLDETIRQIEAATWQMQQNKDPSKTLEDVFDSHFYSGLAIDKQDIGDKILGFYTEVFPTLQPYTRPNPGAKHLVDYLFDQGHRVIIATNPLFPRPATLQRLKWAGVAAEHYPFTLISTYERFHFSKPDPAYYIELLAQAGWPPGPVVMIGDDFEMDIIPASCLDIATFWVHKERHPAIQSASPHSDNILDVIPWLEEVSGSLTEPPIDHPLAQLAVLRSTPAAFHTLTRDLTEPQWKYRADENEWSPAEVVCHLRDVDREVNWPRLNKVISEENPFLPGVATDPWAQERQYIHESGTQALADFIQVRNRITELLSALQPEDWRRIARHAIFGPTQIKELAGFIATHDRVHITQVFNVLQALKLR
ncbi:MAG: DinB family protein [Anaerolineaceae bacterium]|jgi:HAD superfamily hydrolase (TIGR01549 family)